MVQLDYKVTVNKVAGATIAAIHDAKQPTHITELRALLGIVNHYSRFIPNIAARLSPLHNLLHKDEVQSKNKCFMKLNTC